MARGITEIDVLEAADALLSRGERPTIERVRQELGRGSPNTVTRHLDAWWSSLAARIERRDGTGALPASLLELCTKLYAGIGDQAQADARTALIMGQNALQERDAQLQARELELASQRSAIEAAAEKLTRDMTGLHTRNEALATERAQLRGEVERLRVEAEEAEAIAKAVQAGAERAQAEHRAEVQRIRGQWEGNETRWLREIDHLREEAKRLRVEHATGLKVLREQLKEAEARLGAIGKDRSRLEGELAQEREARIRAEASHRATDALVRTLTPRAAISKGPSRRARAAGAAAATKRRAASSEK